MKFQIDEMNHDFDALKSVFHHQYDLFDASYHQKVPPNDQKGEKYDLQGGKYHLGGRMDNEKDVSLRFFDPQNNDLLDS